MTSVPTAVHDEQHAQAQAQPPITMFGPDFPFAYDDFLAHPAGLGSVPPPSTAPRSRSSAADCPASSPRTS